MAPFSDLTSEDGMKEIVTNRVKICKMCLWNSFCNSNPFVAPWVSEHIQWRHSLQLILLRRLCCRIKLLSVCQDDFCRTKIGNQHSARYILVPGDWDIGTLGYAKMVASLLVLIGKPFTITRGLSLLSRQEKRSNWHKVIQSSFFVKNLFIYLRKLRSCLLLFWRYLRSTPRCATLPLSRKVQWLSRKLRPLN